MDNDALSAYIFGKWDDEIVPSLSDYIRIPNKSPAFDAQWAEHGYMDQAVELARAWCEGAAPEGSTVEVVRLEGRTPLLFVEVPGATDDTVLLYGHLDKQPEFDGWRDDLGPWEPVIQDGKLYGRGGADDGYAVFASLTAINALRAQGIAHPRCVLIIECCEESGSYDLPHYIDHLLDRIGEPRLVICLDSECGDYERLWLTTSLRGLVGGRLSVEVLREGVHSGAASGIIPSSFRLLRGLIERIEDSATGDIKIDALHCQIPPERMREARSTAAILGDTVFGKFPAAETLRPMSDDPAEQLINSTWRPYMAVTGASGLPALDQSGNVLRPRTTAMLSFRAAPGADTGAAARAIKQALEADPPSGAKVRFEIDAAEDGWNMPDMEPWLVDALDQASNEFFGTGHELAGCGGSIPFMDSLAERFPKTQFVVTGVLGPASNAHGPNEFLHIEMGKKVTCCVAHVLARAAGQMGG